MTPSHPSDADLIERMVESVRRQYEDLGREAEAQACEKVLYGIRHRSYGQHLTHDEYVASGRDDSPWTRPPASRTPDDALLIRATAALSVVALDPKIQAWLLRNDPMAHGQVEATRASLLARTRDLGREAWEAQGFSLPQAGTDRPGSGEAA